MFRNHSDRRFKRGKALWFIPLFLIMISVISLIVQKLWNAILPEITTIKNISYTQALGLLVLCRILFGNFGFRGRQNHNNRQHFRDNIRGMSPEDRQRFKDEWTKRCRK